MSMHRRIVRWAGLALCLMVGVAAPARAQRVAVPEVVADEAARRQVDAAVLKAVWAAAAAASDPGESHNVLVAAVTLADRLGDQRLLGQACERLSFMLFQQGQLLEAREVMDLALDADLAVLSACETGGGRFRAGEGQIGMSWAFLVAGTPTTVVSQWKVHEASTSQLMLAFHRALLAPGHRPLAARAQALRDASRQVARSTFSHPFYWAAFTMIGDGY